MLVEVFSHRERQRIAALFQSSSIRFELSRNFSKSGKVEAHFRRFALSSSLNLNADLTQCSVSNRPVRNGLGRAEFAQSHLLKDLVRRLQQAQAIKDMKLFSGEVRTGICTVCQKFRKEVRPVFYLSNDRLCDVCERQKQSALLHPCAFISPIISPERDINGCRRAQCCQRLPIEQCCGVRPEVPPRPEPCPNLSSSLSAIHGRLPCARGI